MFESDDEVIDGTLVLGTSALWNKNIHGGDSESNKKITTHWIFHDKIEINEINSMPDPHGVLRYELCKINNLNTGETIAIFKTFWLKIVQRKWKKIYAIRKNIENERKSIHSLKYRERHGKWPPHINYMPSIIGMC